MLSVADQTESLLAATRQLLTDRGELTLRQIADGSGVPLEWLRKFTYAGTEKPDVARVELVHGFLVSIQTVKRYESREARAP